MANFSNPRGCIALRYDQDTFDYPIDAANPEIGQNDPLERRADGFLYPCTAGSAFPPVGWSAIHVPANTGGMIPVYQMKVDQTTFQIQAADAGVDSEADYTFEYDWLPGAPDPVTGVSTYQLDPATKDNDATLPIKIIRKVEFAYPDTNDFGAFVKLECVINDHLFKSQGTLG